MKDPKMSIILGALVLWCFGAWEIDMVLGKHGSSAIVTILERATRLYLIKKVVSKSAAEVSKATLELLRSYNKFVHTIMANNGREFVGHMEIAQILKADVYFAHPYSSWKRGVNENANELLRQYIKKETDLRSVSDDEVEQAQLRINYSPKKCLEFKQPTVIFNKRMLFT